ncbi:MAG TPA: protein kinase [Kofleriaceae bacterium]
MTQDAFVGQQVARYRITRLLGKGGMGRVYLAVHPEIGSRVAIKVLSDEWADAPDVLDRFFAEARTVNLISHDNIIKVLDLDRTPTGRPYIVMEYVEGKTLREVIALGHAPLGGIAHVMTEVLLALEAAHGASVVHRDLKPDNVMVTASGHAKVLDFGIAKLATDRTLRTRTGAAVGTPPYMAPEQILGEPLDGRTDLYAAGVMMFELVTGTRPFDGATDFQIMQAHLGTEPVSPRSLRADLPDGIAAVILQALAKRPADRFASARAMAHAIRIASADLPEHQWRHLSSMWLPSAPSASFTELPAITSQPTVPALPATLPDASPPGRLDRKTRTLEPRVEPTPPNARVDADVDPRAAPLERAEGRLDQKTRPLTPPGRESAPIRPSERAADEPRAIAPMRPSAPALPRRRRVVLGVIALLLVFTILGLVLWTARQPDRAVVDLTPDGIPAAPDTTTLALAPDVAPVDLPLPIDAASTSPNDGATRVPDAVQQIARRDASVVRPDAQVAAEPPRDAAVTVAKAPTTSLGNPPIKDEPTIPPRRSQEFVLEMPATDLDKFDPAAWAPVAQKYARMLEPDAALTVLDASVRDDGTAFVGINVRLNFRSEAARKANDPMRLPCIVVLPSARSLRITRYDYCEPTAPVAKLPRCRFPAVFPGKVAKHAEARSVHLSYNANGWRVTQYREKPEKMKQQPLEKKTLPDDC